MAVSWLSLLNHRNSFKNQCSWYSGFNKHTGNHTTTDLTTWSKRGLKGTNQKAIRTLKYWTFQHRRDQVLLVTDHTLTTALSVQSPIKTNGIAEIPLIVKTNKKTRWLNLLWTFAKCIMATQMNRTSLPRGISDYATFSFSNTEY